MNKSLALIYLLAASIFVIYFASASSIALSGSDLEPFEITVAGQCANPMVSVVFDDPNKPNPKIVEVHLAGDFSPCLGSQVLVTTYKTGRIHSYAVAEVLDANPKIIFRFENKRGVGDFYQKFPKVTDHRLVAVGPLAPPNESIDPAEIQVTFAWFWN